MLSKTSLACMTALFSCRAWSSEMNESPSGAKRRSNTFWLRTRAQVERLGRYTADPPRGVAPVPILVVKSFSLAVVHFGGIAPSGDCSMGRSLYAISESLQVRANGLLQLSRLGERHGQFIVPPERPGIGGRSGAIRAVSLEADDVHGLVLGRGSGRRRKQRYA